METYVKDAEEIWAELKNRLKNDKSFRDMDDDSRLEFYQKKHNVFTMAFPIVLRYMVQLRQYHKKAFVKFVKKMTSNPYRSELEYCERQADYVKYLYMELTPRYTMPEAQDIWKQTYDILVKEVDVFKKAEETVKQKLEINNNLNSIEKRKELKEALGL
jgi:DNA-binding MltR family transcriptional regulator